MIDENAEREAFHEWEGQNSPTPLEAWLARALLSASKPAAPSVAQDERGAFEQAFQLVFDAYSAPRDRWNTDDGYILFLRGKVTRAFSLLQQARAAAAPAQSGEPIYQVRENLRLDEWKDCSKDAYGHMAKYPACFETRIVYTAPQPAQVIDKAMVKRLAIQYGLIPDS